MKTTQAIVPYFNLARILWALVTLAAIVATYSDTASRGPVQPMNFFGYFTIQSNALLVAVWIVAGTAGLVKAERVTRWVVGLRALVCVCMAVVGLIYLTLLAPLGAAGGVPLPWANWVMHILGPLVILGDWLLSKDRVVLPYTAVFLILIYPMLWTGVVLVRGATDGWVPYPFLNPEQGYGVISLYVVAIAAVFAGIAVFVVAYGRRRRHRDVQLEIR
ncbi:Pr6Pr family membrane protein [Glutamicibacter sp. FBE19]|uniref:Pr6Pr family membrane protein n=1 Tax=Glutamicibacter sp. FBE19 TaxID=2761534 RepID=UPI0018964938|nr:Pr6Pr family membrane protein [Glutamicibacter sp. FBE19]MBF6672050.1 Pr6Pr family membrane protein [Glutamicibacter sp. FBE19]